MLFFDKDGKTKLVFIKIWLEKYNMGITDMIYTANNFWVVNDMEIITGIEHLKGNIYDWIKDDIVNTIYFRNVGTGKSAYGLLRRWNKFQFKGKLEYGNYIINSKEQYKTINIIISAGRNKNTNFPNQNITPNLIVKKGFN